MISKVEFAVGEKSSQLKEVSWLFFFFCLSGWWLFFLSFFFSWGRMDLEWKAVGKEEFPFQVPRRIVSFCLVQSKWISYSFKKKIAKCIYVDEGVVFLLEKGLCSVWVFLFKLKTSSWRYFCLLLVTKK